MLLYSGLHRLDAGTAAMTSAVELPLTVLLAAIIVADRITPLQIAGSAVILVAVTSLGYTATRAPQDLPPGP